jgi:hypothetical protein
MGHGMTQSLHNFRCLDPNIKKPPTAQWYKGTPLQLVCSGSTLGGASEERKVFVTDGMSFFFLIRFFLLTDFVCNLLDF